MISTNEYGDVAVFLSAGGYHHHIGFNTWQSKGAQKAPSRGLGLFHVAITYAERKELAEVLKQLPDNEYPISGAANHGVSEAIYLNGPDGDGIECIGISLKRNGLLMKKQTCRCLAARLIFTHFERIGVIDISVILFSSRQRK